jgi:hypothetical protein
MLYSAGISQSSSPESIALPRWARLLDFLCLLIALVALIVAMSGGFRVRLGSLRIALTSPYRLLAAAVLMSIGRHLAFRGRPIYRDLPARVMTSWKTPDVSMAASALVGTRLAILFVGYLAVFMFGYRVGGAPWKIVENEFVNLQARWDTGWYLGVAIDGYSYDPAHPGDQQNIVFFPAYPILMRAAGRLLGGASTAYLLGGTLISLGAFFGALIYLFRLARDLLGDEDQARYAIWLIAAYPFALFYGAVYSESLYLLGVAAAVYHFRRGSFARAGAWGLLVGLTRPPGAFLALPLALMALSSTLPVWLNGGRPRDLSPAENRSRDRRLLPALISAAMPGVGVLLYSAYTWQLTGHPLAWEEGHIAWGRQYNGLSILVAQRYEWLSHGGLYEYTSQLPGDLLNLLGALFVLAAVWPVWRRLGLPYAVFILVNMLPPLAAGGLLSAGRFSSVLFPAFIWLAAASPRRHRFAWIASFMAVQAFNAALFYTWRPLY